MYFTIHTPDDCECTQTKLSACLIGVCVILFTESFNEYPEVITL